MKDLEDYEEESVDDEEQTSSSDESDLEDGDDERVQEFRRKIEETLRVNGVEAATGNSDEESDEDLMDDDQMMAIDEQLAQVFRLRVNEKKSSKGQSSHSL
jgi:DNA polymerase phi